MDLHVEMLSRIHVIFGRVVDGQQFVTEMENQKVDANHRPYADVRITNCGELVLLRRECFGLAHFIFFFFAQVISLFFLHSLSLSLSLLSLSVMFVLFFDWCRW